MKMSRKWLNEFVDLSLEEYDDHTFGEDMTVSGSTVEVTDDLSKTLHGVNRLSKVAQLAVVIVLDDDAVVFHRPIQQFVSPSHRHYRSGRELV